MKNNNNKNDEKRNTESLQNVYLYITRKITIMKYIKLYEKRTEPKEWRKQTVTA